MKVAISSNGKDLESEIDPRFGRCAYFLIVNTDNLHVEAFDNGSIAMSGGAGIQAAEFVSSKGAEAVITGNCGPNAVKALKAAGIKLFTGQTGPVRNAIDEFTKGNLERATEANVPDHYGMGGGQQEPQWGEDSASLGRGQGRGMGKGQGCGRGMMRKSGFSGWGNEEFQDQPVTFKKENDLKFLKQQTIDLKTQLDALESRISRLEKG
ncbi:NifB/NifX family molybdenum-iron cluster-binding protein [Thermodesulfobacteriota bacterium]